LLVIVILPLILGTIVAYREDHEHDQDHAQDLLIV